MRRCFLYLTGLLVILYCFLAHKNGFNFDKVLSCDTFQSEWAVSSPAFLSDIFSQPFIYLTSGSQSYVFISQDQKYVIKFLKKKHMNPKKWLKYIDLPVLSNYRYKKVDKREENLKRTFDVIKTAFDEFKEDVGLVYIHLNPSHDLKIHLPLLYKDKELRANLDELPFLVQEKAELLYPRLTCMMENNNTAGTVNAIRSLFNLIQNRGERGFVDLDGCFSNNYGFIGDRAVQIDIGCLVPTCNQSSAIQEIRQIGESLKKQIASQYPQLLPDLENLISEFSFEDQKSSIY